ncbi:MAG TPA: hypothetical protein VGM02_07050, partial [Acidobacteriaceae bacterium]
MPSRPPDFLSVTPMIPTGSPLVEALKFYTEQMGFSVQWTAEHGAGIARGAVAFNLVENSNREWIENTSLSIGVSNLEMLYNEYRDTAAKVGPLEMKAWGRREFHMIVPSGVCLQF